jgi:hypothetical protein
MATSWADAVAIRTRPKWPICGARRRRTGEPCTAPAAPHPRRPDRPCRSGRCRGHGGTSTGPKTAIGKATIAAKLRATWAAIHEAEGKRRPPEILRRLLERLLSATTWAEAMDLTGLSRRTLERVERGSYCSPDELLTLADLMRLTKADVPELAPFDEDGLLASKGG